MNTKIFASLGVLAIATAGATYGTYAFFSDTESATGNLFTAGDLDLTLNGLHGVTGTILAANFAPGDNAGGSILLRNEGSIFTGDAQGHIVDLDLYAMTGVYDDAGNPNDPEDGGLAASDLDRFLVLTTLTYDGVDLLSVIGDADNDGRANTMSDLEAHGTFLDLVDPGAAGRLLVIGVHFSTAGGNDLKRDVVDLTFTFYLAQQAAADLALPVATTFDFETSDGGFTHSGTADHWAYGTDSRYAAATGTKMWGFGLGRTEDVPPCADGHLYSPPIYLPSTGSGVSFQFAAINDIGSTDPDQGQVRVSTDNGATWTVVYVSPFDHEQTWRSHAIDLGSYAGQTILLDFWYHDDCTHGHTGWFIDDISFVF